ncbi:MAG: Transaldolase [Verrucomicrobia bacterium ADurb.Bin345]|nr:MAG: Transaldolase [Verrucomicrobia bacterium ADurb.Bin345]
MNMTVSKLAELRVKIFSDGADLDSIIDAYQAGVVKGFTTNPTLMSKAGITNYLAFAAEVLRVVKDLSVSFEVFSDEFDEMEEQAHKLAELADNVYVKIPVTNTRRETAAPLIRKLSSAGLKLNVTAILSIAQVKNVAAALNPGVPAIVSVFAGRIADSGRDPLPIMKESLEILKPLPKAELLWASPREALNIIQAEQIGCHIITVTPDLLAKTKNFGKDLEDFSLETVKMFYNDAVKSGFSI